MEADTSASGPEATGETLVEFLEDSARKFGPREALLFKPGFRYLRWTYADLWEQAGQVAALLQRKGLTKGDRALLWGPNCPPVGAGLLWLSSSRRHRGASGPAQHARLRTECSLPDPATDCLCFPNRHART